MSQIDSIGFIGAGKMAEAIIKGIIASDFVMPENIFFHDPSEERSLFVAHEYRAINCSSNEEVCEKSRLIVLAVKPQQLNLVLEGMAETITPDHLLISIAAGITIERIKRVLQKNTKVIRTMPNTPCLLGCGMTAIAADEACTHADTACAKAIFDSLGKTLITPESNIDIVTAISGSGPAYVYEIAEQFAQAGVNHNLLYTDALLLITQTLIGAAKMIEQSNSSTKELITMVSSPGGTTLAGLGVLQNGVLADIIKKTVDAAKNRAEELSRG